MDEEPREEETMQAALGKEILSDPAGELRELFLAHRRRVYRAAYRITGNGMDAEDVLQTVFLRLLKGERSLLGAETSGAYLHLAAVNASLDVLRARRSARSESLEERELPRVESPAPDPQRRLEEQEIRAKVQESLTRLAPLAAQTFVLRYFEGYRNQEIARMLGVSRTSVAVSLHRARRRIQKDIRSWMSGGLP